ncbi:MAG: hypothetical protein PHV20_12465 [Bacteroidales bacterium]|nr:hypothetical protein [Bacteroidales bacterium]
MATNNEKKYTRAQFEEAAERKNRNIVFAQLMSDTINHIAKGDHVHHVTKAKGTYQVGNITKSTSWTSEGKCFANGKHFPDLDLNF